MMNRHALWSFRIANYLYKYAFPIYFPLYTAYKALSDRTEQRVLKQMIKPGDCVLDIGANVGFYTRCFAHLVGPSGEVHAFEPDPQNFYRLQQHTQRLKNVTIYQAGLSQQTGPLLLYHSDELNVDHRTYRTDEARNTQTVPGICLDDQWANRRINFIKMDIQGHEYAALLGMQQTLRQNPNLQMMLELWPYGLRQAGSDYHALLRLLDTLTFQSYVVSHNAIKTLTDAVISDEPTEYYTLFVTKQKIHSKREYETVFLPPSA